MQPRNGWQETSHQLSRKPSILNAKQAMQTLPRMWIHGNKLKVLLPDITEYIWTSPHTTQSTLRNVLESPAARDDCEEFGAQRLSISACDDWSSTSKIVLDNEIHPDYPARG